MHKTPHIATITAVAFALAAAPALAKTTTWRGTANDTGLRFDAAANWSGGVPESGDTVVIDTAGTAYNNPVTIGVEGESFDIGAAGLTFEVTRGFTKLLVNFTGTGKIVKTGAGRLGFGVNSSFTGGTEIREGKLEPWKSGTPSFGTAAVEFESDGTTEPGLQTDIWGTGIGNALEFTGSIGEYTALSSGQPFTFGGTVSSTHDLAFTSWGTGKLTFNAAISAAGSIITVDSSDVRNTNTLARAVDANVKAKGVGLLLLSGNSPASGNTLTVENGNCEISASAFWGGDVAFSGSTANLTLRGEANLSPSAGISIDEGCTAKLYLAGGSATVKSLSIGGVTVADGTYTAANLPAAIGSGTLVVSSAKRTVWIGGMTGTGSGYAEGTPQSFFDQANWDNGVPAAGDTIVVTNSTAQWNRHVFFGTSGETLDIGAKGITIDNAGWIKCAVKFTGSGKIVKVGSGVFGVSIDSEHSGGTEIYTGTFLSYRGSLGFGTGPVEFIASEMSVPYLSPNINSGAGITNSVVFSGTGSYKVFSPGNTFHFRGPVCSAHDFEIEERYEPMYFHGDVSAPGHTFTVNANRTTDETHQPHIYFAKSVDANIVKTGNRTMFLNGSTANPDHSLTVSQGTCTIAAAGYWGGTNVVVGASATALSLNGAGNLAPEAVVRITTSGGAKINVASGVKVQIAKLFVNGVEQAPGIYNSSNLPSVVAGAGRLSVGVPATVLSVR